MMEIKKESHVAVTTRERDRVATRCIQSEKGGSLVKKVTIQDIAQQMNLSRNTVAKALNDGAVSYETKISVLQTAYEMGYAKLTEEHLSQLKSVQGERNGLVNNRAVLVLSGRSQEVFWNRILAGISAELNCSGYRMLLQFVEE